MLIAGGVSPRVRGVIATYLRGSGVELVDLAQEAGCVSPRQLEQALASTPEVACVLIQQPNFCGLLEPLAEIGGRVQARTEKRPHLVVMADPLSLGLLTPPGACGADTVVGELQSLGLPAQFGGPTAGYFATQSRHIRRLPGRLVAETTDRQGRRGFTLTLQTREQHIRREKATSNICTNSALIALRATIFLALLGPRGLREAAAQSLQRSHYALERLLAIPGVERVYPGPFFREFAIALPVAAEELVERIYASSNILAGVPLGRFWPDRKQQLLVAVTEQRSRDDIEALALAVHKEIGA
jgi:glycine dehydrogenase subunit 1